MVRPGSKHLDLLCHPVSRPFQSWVSQGMPVSSQNPLKPQTWLQDIGKPRQDQPNYIGSLGYKANPVSLSKKAEIVWEWSGEGRGPEAKRFGFLAPLCPPSRSWGGYRRSLHPGFAMTSCALRPRV